MSRFTFAIPDLHGRLDLLEKAYVAISEHAKGMPGTIVHLGDYIDRGPQSREVIEWLMEDASLPPGWIRICLRGNHESIMWETIKAPLNPRWWINNGGGPTLASYGHVSKGTYTPSVVLPAHLDWIEALPNIHIDQHRVFVHAKVDRDRDLTDQTVETMQWGYYDRADVDPHGEHHIVHGHDSRTGFLLGPGRTCLDTSAWFHGKLAVGVFDDLKPGGPADVLMVEGEPAVTMVPA